MIIRKSKNVLLGTAVLLLVACQSASTYDETGRLAAGPIGQPPMITPSVEPLVKAGISACMDYALTGSNIDRLNNQGFRPATGGLVNPGVIKDVFVASIPNPNDFGNGQVKASIGGRACGVNVSPAIAAEVPTLIVLTEEVMAERGIQVEYETLGFQDRANSYAITVAFKPGQGN